MCEGVPVMVRGGLGWSRLTVDPKDGRDLHKESWIEAHKPDPYMARIGTAEVVAMRYGIGREAQDEYAVQSQARTAAGQDAGRA